MAETASKSRLLDMIKNKKRTLTVTTVYRKDSSPSTKISPKPLSPPQTKSSPLNGVSRMTSSRHASISNSRQSSKEPRDKQRKVRPVKSASPAISTPKFTSSDDDDDDEAELRRKRARIDRRTTIDKDRRIRNQFAFQESLDNRKFNIIHAADIANSETQVHGRYT